MSANSPPFGLEKENAKGYPCRPVDGEVRIPIPLPEKLHCALCTQCRGYSSKMKHTYAICHLNDKHDAEAEAIFVCRMCGAENLFLQAANQHAKKLCPKLQHRTTTVPRGKSHAEIEISETSLETGNFIVNGVSVEMSVLVCLYPCGPSRCPLCLYFSKATIGTRAAETLKKHLAIKHRIKIVKSYVCRICKFKGPDYVMREHHKMVHRKGRRKLDNNEADKDGTDDDEIEDGDPDDDDTNDDDISDGDTDVDETEEDEIEADDTDDDSREEGPTRETNSEMAPLEDTEEEAKRDTEEEAYKITEEEALENTEEEAFIDSEEEATTNSEEEAMQVTEEEASDVSADEASAAPIEEWRNGQPSTQPAQSDDSEYESTEEGEDLTGSGILTPRLPRPDVTPVNPSSSTRMSGWLNPPLARDLMRNLLNQSRRLSAVSPRLPTFDAQSSQSQSLSLPHTPIASSPSNVSTSPEASTDLASPTSLSSPPPPNLAESFASRWRRSFQQCSTIEMLEAKIEECAVEWRSLCQVRNRPVNQPVKEARENRPPSQGGRQQSRQQQRIRRQKRKNGDAASDIQKLFNLYPRRAVRKALGEDSPTFSGDAAEAGVWLKQTYERPIPTPEQISKARETFDSCDWSPPDEIDNVFLSAPPTKEEISWKIKHATNTAPGQDRIEYRHIKALDPACILLESMFGAVWKLGIPQQWKSAKTILIYKKGDRGDISNFRPISLLSTLYKLFSGVLTSKIVSTAQANNWLSPEQKGFLPGVRGIQEHTQLLQTIVDEAKRKKSSFSMSWLDLTNAFGSMPHAFLAELFHSLPIPDNLRRILLDIYSRNVTDFVVGKSTVSVCPTTGVRQGDALSTIVFCLAAEPLVRAAKANTNPGLKILGITIKATAYADDIAVITEKHHDQQTAINELSKTARKIGLTFNPSKCVNFSMEKGRTCEGDVRIDNRPLRSLQDDEHEVYLGTPIGSRLLFRPTTDLPEKMHKLADSLLAPWQKLEVFRAHLIPSLSHHLASGKVEKKFLHELDQRCRDFLRLVTNLPTSSADAFFYADRRVGGLGVTPLAIDADIWTIARAAQLIDSNDPIARKLFRNQVETEIRERLRGERQEFPSISAFLSGSMEDGLYDMQNSGRGCANIWMRARHAAKRMKVQIDVSGDEAPTKLVADDISAISVKAVRALRTVVRQRKTSAFLALASQGRVAQGLALDTTTNDIAQMTSTRTPLTFQEWSYIYRGRLDLLPLRGCPGPITSRADCRYCKKYKETTLHVVNGCEYTRSKARERHNVVLDHLVSTLRRSGHNRLDVDRTYGCSLRPDIVVKSVDPPLLIDVAVAFDDPDTLGKAYDEKIRKYQNLGCTLPLIVGSFGSWFPENQEIRRKLGITDHIWNAFRKRARLAAIQGSVKIIQHYLGMPNSDDESGMNSHTDLGGGQTGQETRLA